MSAVAKPVRRARILDVTHEQYLADPCATPSLNQSTAHVMLTKSPLHAWHQHPRLGKARYRWDIVRALPPMRRTRDRSEAEAFLRDLRA